MAASPAVHLRGQARGLERAQRLVAERLRLGAGSVDGPAIE